MPHLPVIIGVGQHTYRGADDPPEAEPLRLIEAACRAAADDSGVDALAAVRAVTVMRVGSWRYDDLPALVNDALGGGAPAARRTTAPFSGDAPLRALDAAATRIAAGEEGVTLVTGAEATRASNRNGARGVVPRWTAAAARGGGRPPFDASMAGAFRAGIVRALDLFPLYDNALRAHEGMTLADGTRESAELWAAMSRVAADNPYAWVRDRVDVDTLLDTGPHNRPVVLPYSKLLTANPFVNQAAAVLVADDETARRLGVPERRWVYVRGAAGSDEPEDPRARVAYHRNPALEVALEDVQRATGTSGGDYDHVELYSCFPAMPKLTSRVLGALRPGALTVTGGLTFAGGPGANFMTHGLAAMTERLRAGGGTGLLHGVGMFNTRHHAVVLGDAPQPGGYARGGAGGEAVRTMPGVPVVDDYAGPATIVTYGVTFDRAGTAERGVVIADGPRGERLAAAVPAGDADAIAAVARRGGEPVGLAGTVVTGDHGLQFHL